MTILIALDWERFMVEREDRSFSAYRDDPKAVFIRKLGPRMWWFCCEVHLQLGLWFWFMIAHFYWQNRPTEFLKRYIILIGTTNRGKIILRVRRKSLQNKKLRPNADLSWFIALSSLTCRPRPTELNNNISLIRMSFKTWCNCFIVNVFYCA